MQNKSFISLLKKANVQYTLLDLGASGETYPPFNPLTEVAHFILVDPDDRDFDKVTNTVSNETRIGKAITESEEAKSIKIFLTKNPHCSSTLYPDYQKLEKFAYADYFEVVDQCEVAATSLNHIAADYKIKNFDWIKLDTQGTELRILKSLKPQLFDDLLCIDVEISLYPHYEGADTFPILHEYLANAGFTITHFHSQKRIKIPKDNLSHLLNDKSPFIQRQIRKSINPIPTSPEIRYIRNFTPAIAENRALAIKLWGLHYITQDYAQCYTIAQKLAQRYPDQEMQALEAITQKAINKPTRLYKLAVKRLLEKWVNKYLSGTN